MTNPGAAIDWSDDDLTRLATISVDDITAAKAWWREHCRPADRMLLEDGSDDEARCLAALDAVLSSSETLTADLCDRLASGAIDTAGWQLGMLEVVRMNHLCAVAAGRGGWSRISVADVLA